MVTRPLVIAHRGYSARYPENTIASYEGAVAAGADIVESDIRLSADGVGFSCHDEDLGRLTGDGRPVATLCAAELDRVVLPGGERLMRHADVLARVSPQIPVLVDVKTPDAAVIDAVLAAVRETGALPRVWVGVREIAQARQLKRAEPDIAILAFLPDYDRAEEFRQAGCTAFRVWEGHLGRPNVRALFGRLPVWITMGHMDTPFGVGDTNAERLAAALALGPAGILINDLALVNAA